MKSEQYNLSNPQKSIWMTEQYYKGTSVNTICGYNFISDEVNLDILKRAINELVKNNDAMRIKLKIKNNDVTQYVDEYHPFEIDTLLVYSEDDLYKKISEIANTSLDIEKDQLFKFYVFRLPNKTGGIIVNVHHLIGDSWSLGLIAKEVIKIYEGLLNGTYESTKMPSYITYLKQEEEYKKSEKYVKDKEYWDKMFEIIPEVAAIPSQKEEKKAMTSCEGKRKKFEFNQNLLEKIKAFCNTNKISIYNFFMAVYSIYISRVSNIDDFVIGTPILNRTNFEQKHTMGMFVNVVPQRITLNQDMSFIDHCKKISIDSMSIFRHQKYLYQNILEDIREKDPSIPNLYNIVLSYQITKTTEETEVKYTTDWVFNGTSADDLQIQLFDINGENGLTVAYDYKSDKYDEKDILALHNRILFLIKQIDENNIITLKDLDIITENEKDDVLNKFNNTYFKYDISKTVVDYIEEQVNKTPDNIAIICGGKSLSYRELNEKANQLARHLIFNNVKEKDVIGIMVHRSIEMIIGLLGILKAGGTYLPIDPEYPVDRIDYMLENSECRTILVHSSTLNLIKTDINKIDISLDSFIYSANNIENLNLKIDPDNLIYMIYTSGSTGKPKGVMITHRNINNFILAEKKYIDFSEEKTMISVTTMCFDIFALEIWCSLTYGMRVVVANDTEQSSPKLIEELCKKYNVDMIQTTPSRFSALLLDSENLEYLKGFSDIMVGGEGFPKALLEKLQQNTNANIWNMYGPTETTVWSTIKKMSNTDIITIGKPIANTTCYVLDKNKKLLPPGTPGELYIGGDGVSKGYWKLDELTNDKFIKSPFKDDEIIYNTNDLAYFTDEGEIVHLGRTDFQVKIRGYRIELEEIQNKLLEFPGISNCVVISKDNRFLVCYYTANKEYQSSEISGFLWNYLPSYMIPSYYIRINEIPMTPNGKLNRALLPEITDTNLEIEEAKTDTEIKISSVISKIIDVSQLDINTPFINLGLDSLGIIRTQTMLLKYGFSITTQDFYKYSTIKKLAERIDSNVVSEAESDIDIPSEFCHTEEKTKLSLSSINVNEDSFNNVFLTGANGFVGIHILRELLVNTNNVIYCLVRGNNKDQSFDRLRNIYNFYFGVDISKYINDRIFIVCSNINDKYLGLSQNEIDNFETIIHTAAIVKHYGNFEDFENVNIKGTENIADFAYNHNKRLIHISSISVSGNYLVNQDNRDIDFSENNIYIGQHYNDNVYVRSKLEAERIVLSYMRKGLTAQIHRIGILSGRYSDGVFQEKIVENAFYSRIKSMLSLKAISDDMLEQEIEFTPVDYCARAIITLGKQSACNNKIFHLYNHNLIKVKELIEIFKKYNINIKILSKKEFNDYIYELSQDQSNTALNSIINDLSYNANHLLSLNYDFTVNVKSEITQQYLKALNYNWPKCNDFYIKKILDYMINVGFLGL